MDTIASDRESRLAEFRAALKQRILLLDCAMGTMIQSYDLSDEDYRGERFADHPGELKGNNDLLTLTQPPRSFRTSTKPHLKPARTS